MSRLAAVLLACAGLLGLSACGSEPKAEHGKTLVRMAMPSNGAGFWPAYIALDEGFFAEEGLDVREVEIDPNIIVSALIGNSADIAYADATQLLSAIEKKAPLVAVGLALDKQPYRLMARPELKSVADLKGKTIGATSELDVYTYVIGQMLRNAGLDPAKDVVWAYGGNQTRRLAAMNGGAIDAGLYSPPSDSRLARDKYSDLGFAPDLFPELTLSAQAVRRDWAEKNGETLRKLLRAEGRAVDWLNDPANKARAMEIVMKHTGASAEDAEAAWAYYAGKRIWPDACIREAGLATAIKVMRATGLLTTMTEADAGKIVDRQWCPA